MHLKQKLEPYLRKMGLEWADVVPVLEAIDSVEELKDAVAEPEAFLARLAEWENEELRGQLEAKDTQLEANATQLEAKDMELEAKYMELEANATQLEAKDMELEAKDMELEARL